MSVFVIVVVVDATSSLIMSLYQYIRTACIGCGDHTDVFILWLISMAHVLCIVFVVVYMLVYGSVYGVM